ncbi:MAG TPA: serine/threonine-protein kinase, partial [Kofleriaceae bacterium]|nr:serine/threonine-protein kinase [Kofleriaceae bacterium]
EDGVVYIAMEYLHGQDLRAIGLRAWRDGRLALDAAIAIVLSVCAGLHYAHDKRDSDGSALEIVHRDVSPSNVIVTYDGGVKLIDFGIAKATSLPRETRLGLVKGKPGYMSPEQCRSESIDRRSDVFCVGIVLYELTTGARPFGDGSDYDVTRAIVESDPLPPRDPSYPSALEAIVRRALAKDRRDRYPTAKALHDQLTAFASELGLDVSQFALQRTMASLFDAELGAWHSAQADERSLVDYVLHTKGMVVEPIVHTPRRSRVVVAGALGALAVVTGLAFHYTSSDSDGPPAAAVVTSQPADAAAVPDAQLASAPVDAVVVPTAAKPVHKTRVRPPDPKRPAAKRTDPDEIIR